MQQYTRPTIRPRVNVEARPPRAVPVGAPGIVGELSTAMRAPPSVPRHETAWTPPYDFEFLASMTVPESEREAYLKRCTEWFAAHPPVVRVLKPVTEPIDTELVASLYASYGTVLPPLEKRIATWEAAGYSEATVIKSRKFHKRMEETSDERQRVLDAIFSRWPTASKPTPKPKKVIKAVKKKLV